MKSGHLLLLAGEVERTFYEFSPAWEGTEVQVTDFGEAVLQAQTWFAAALRLRFDTLNTDKRLDEVIKQVEMRTPRCLWFIGPSTRPTDLRERLVARGFEQQLAWEGLVLDDLSTEIPTNPRVLIEPLSQENAEAYATAMAGDAESPYRSVFLAQAHRFLEVSPQEVQITLARWDGHIAGRAVVRFEPNGVVYLRHALTLPAFRNHGVYLSLVAHRLNMARASGCTAAVLQTQTRTSAPILIKHGFKSVCRLIGLARKPPTSTTNG